MKALKCRNCKKKHTPFNSLNNWCQEIDCQTARAMFLLEKAKKKGKQDWAKEKKTLKESLKTKADYEKELEVIFNTFIRLRDANEPCISCEAPAGSFTLSAGHYYPAGSNKNIRFNEDNVHVQCWFNCNKNKHGNLSEYLPRLIKKIGQDRFNKLLHKKNTPRHYAIYELKELKVIYRAKIKELKLKQ